MTHDEEKFDYDRLKDGDWSADITTVHERVMANVRESTATPKNSRNGLAFAVTAALVAIVAMVAFNQDAATPTKHVLDSAPSSVAISPLEGSVNTPETVMARAEPVSVHAKIAPMKILTDDPNIIILIVD